MKTTLPDGVEIVSPISTAQAEILKREALSFLTRMHRTFNDRRKELLTARVKRQAALNAGIKPDFLQETRDIRESDWRIASIPADIEDRRVEITGPVDRKMIINALNSGAKAFMADFEDSTTPTWGNLLEGHINLCDAVRRTITYSDPTTRKDYKLVDSPAVLFVRPRGWHLDERHVTVDGEPMSGALFDFGLYAFHNAKELLARGSGPYFYLPKIESHLEARLWNEIFVVAEAELGIPKNSIKSTVLIETILAAFEMDEILYELRDHSCGLNCGRWDYIFSFIKKFAGDISIVLPDRGSITMNAHFMRSYSKLCIKTCHRRGAHAMGGMSALIPSKSDSEANERAIAGVRADKEREASDGHDGTWVAHPGLVAVAREVFDRIMPQANQIARKHDDYKVTQEDLLKVPTGAVTETGLKQNIAVGLGYIAAWLRGTGCVPLFSLMEDAATAEISRAQLWQWVHHSAKLQDGRPVTMELVQQIANQELEAIKPKIDMERFLAYERAARLIQKLTASSTFPEFLTVPAYAEVLESEGLVS
jgi:malate synthase